MMHSSIKPGDKVLRTRSIEIIPGRWGYGIHKKVLVPVAVERVTATQAVTHDGERFMRDSGRQVSGDAIFFPEGWVPDWGTEREPKQATDLAEIELAIRQKNLFHRAEKAINAIERQWPHVIKYHYAKTAPAELEQDLESLVDTVNRLLSGVKENS